MPESQTPYDELCSLTRQIATLESVSRLVAWDQETYMPAGAAGARARQMAMLAGIVHERKTAPRMGELIQACEEDPDVTGDPLRTACVREMRRDYELATKLPGELVAELARVGSEAQQVWKRARTESDFALFRPSLETMVALTRQKAECYGWGDGEPYDALINEYEPETTARQIEAIFTPLRDRLSAFIAEVRDNGTPPDTSPLDVQIPADRQHALGLFILKSIGFDLQCGRLDTTTHPFCEGLAPGDTRLTTRYHEERFTDALYGTMHEAGHGIYEQGLPKGSHFGTPLGEAISLGIHESQSRMWENFVGRSRAFWTWALPHAREYLGSPIEPFSTGQLTAAVNTASPSLIRVEADEATYNLHIMVRFEIERALISGDLPPADVPGAWNERYKSFLGVDVPDDRRGCLQDVHWAFGLIGYFPTYCLGNLYAAQFWETIRSQIPDLDTQIARGRFDALRIWLNENIHAHGRRYRAGELCERVTGKPLGPDPLLRHLESRIRPAYGL